ncbi:hypothetical protein J6590_030897 [Homalodisca vitripennis]|nr:hypothetical protein J6590_030897 [Homalodisca vitripennis]
MTRANTSGVSRGIETKFRATRATGEIYQLQNIIRYPSTLTRTAGTLQCLASPFARQTARTISCRGEGGSAGQKRGGSDEEEERGSEQRAALTAANSTTTTYSTAQAQHHNCDCGSGQTTGTGKVRPDGDREPAPCGDWQSLVRPPVPDPVPYHCLCFYSVLCSLQPRCLINQDLSRSNLNRS